MRMPFNSNNMISLFGQKLSLKYVILDSLIILVTLFTVIYADETNDGEPDEVALLLSHFNLLVLTNITTIIFYGKSQRWPLNFTQPLIFVMISFRCTLLGKILSLFTVIISAILLVLFPVPSFPSVTGKYAVGVADIFLSVGVESKEEEVALGTDYTVEDGKSFVSVRLLYPTSECSNSGISYIKTKYCDQFNASANGPPLDKLGILLHGWSLVDIPVKRNAKPLYIGPNTMPLAFYSHGLTGSSSLYSYQAISLASEGYLVMCLEHRDGSAFGTKKECGEVVKFDRSPSTMGEEEEILYRRNQINIRTNEIIIACRSLLALNDNDDDALRELGISFRNVLDKRGVLACGHSMGAGTAVCVASRIPNLISGIIAHEPTLNWMPDDARKSFLGRDPTYKGGDVIGYTMNEKVSVFDKLMNIIQRKKCSIHELHMLIVWSEEWYNKGWGESQRVDKMLLDGFLGSKKTLSKVLTIKGAHHTFASDCGMLLPTWLTRPLQITGPACPHESAELAKELSHQFVGMLHKEAKASL